MNIKTHFSISRGFSSDQFSTLWYSFANKPPNPSLSSFMMPYLDFSNLLSCFQITSALKVNTTHMLFQQNSCQFGSSRINNRQAEGVLVRGKENFLYCPKIKIFQETLTHPVPDSCLAILWLRGGKESEKVSIRNN